MSQDTSKTVEPETVEDSGLLKKEAFQMLHQSFRRKLQELEEEQKEIFQKAKDSEKYA